jgi:methyl-accepting chemotaxis protein
MSEMVSQFLLSEAFQGNHRAPANGARPTGNPVVDRALRTAKEPVSAIRSSRPQSNGADSARQKVEEEPVRRRAAGGDTDWKQF